MFSRLTLIACATALVGMSGAALADIPGKDWMSPADVTQKLQDQGYANVTGLEADDGYWEGKGTKNGKVMEFKADPKTGAIVTEKIDN
jgi:hypothetical protein